ncbi:MAG: hypothetical protein GW763_16720 [Paraglaciecola sp.]|nr:hypothetical protein [Paraglaciecola sp.]NCT49595.1 hypothetical protein [Paraglaciecola sp.]
MQNIWRYGLVFVIYQQVAVGQVLNDPTRPASSVASTKDTQGEQSLKLNAIFITDERRLAIINGKSYSAGEQVQGKKVVTILANQVELAGPEGKQVLYVNNNNTKKDVNHGF